MMANQLLNARMRFSRLSDPDSGANRKLRLGALELVGGICGHFPYLSGQQGERHLRLTRGYTISLYPKTESRYRKFVFYRGSEFVCWWFPESGIIGNDSVGIASVELEDVYRLAFDIRHGWLGEVAGTIKRLCGEDAAYKFIQEFRL